MTQASLRVDTRQHQSLTPRLQYAVRLLQLSSVDYEQELHEVMSKNPFLEVQDDARETGQPNADSVVAEAASQPQTSDASEAASASNDSPDGDDTRDALDDRDHWLQSPSGVRNGASDGNTSALDMMVAEIGLRPHLRSQANMLPLSPRDHALVCAVIESLDDDGYLRLALDEIGGIAELEPAADACEMNTALKLVQSFEPAGVGARDVAECLLLQLPQIEPALQALCRAVLTKHLDRLARRDVAGMARLTGSAAAQVEAACQAIRRLDPHPGWRFGRSDTQFVIPDVIVRKSRGQWTAQLNPDIVPKLRLNQAYADLFQQHREGRHAELAAHLQEARWAVRNVEQRFSTILSVARAILRRQHLFFEHGPFAMKPLGLREIAEEVGVHESTVCRVTNNKYMATPAGVFELKYFFSRAMPMRSGGACSATAIRGLIQELLAVEDPAHPMSDVQLAQRLTRQGLAVARRTVTKYRQMLKVESVERRRRPHEAAERVAA